MIARVFVVVAIGSSHTFSKFSTAGSRVDAEIAVQHVYCDDASSGPSWAMNYQSQMFNPASSGR
jgi:hypothetical protein